MKINDILSVLDNYKIKHTFVGNKNTSLNGFSDPREYTNETIVWAMKKKDFTVNNISDLNHLIITGYDSDFVGFANNIIYTADPRDVYYFLVQYFYPIEDKIGISENAKIDETAKIGKNVYIGSNSIVNANVKIGDDVKIGCGVIIYEDTIVESNCVIEDYCVIGANGFGFRKPLNEIMTRIPHQGRVVLKEFVEVGGGTIICKGTFRDTIIGRGTKIDSQCYIGHNVKISENCIIIASKILGNSEIGRDTTLTSSTVKNRIRIGDNVNIGIGSVVVSDIDDYSTCFGNPATQITNSKSSKTRVRKYDNDFLDLVADVFDVESSDIDLNTEYEKYRIWDSLMHIRLISEIETKYNITIPINEFNEIKTLGNLYELVSRDDSKGESNFIEHVSKIFNVNSSEINLDTEYEKFSIWDSLMHIRLISEIESIYNISIPMNRFSNIKTLRTLFEFTKKANYLI